MRTRRRAGGARCGELAGVIALPVIGGGVFVALFAAANPLIGDALGAVRLPGMDTALMHLFWWGLVLLAVRPSLRPIAPSEPGRGGRCAGPVSRSRLRR